MAPPSERTICALAEVMTPSLQGDEAKLARVYSTFLYTFGDLPADSRRKLSLLVHVLNGWSRLRTGRALADVPVDRREQLCRAVAEAPIDTLAAGFTGLRSLILMATYSEPMMWDAIGYSGPTVEG
jgi:hypothetical protein